MSHEEDTPASLPGWFVTYADLMSLLLTFFIMLASFSEVREQEKYQALKASMRRQFGHGVGDMAVATGWTNPRNPMMATLTTIARARKHELMPTAEKESTSTARILRTAEFLEQELRIPTERIHISTAAGDEARVEIFLPDDTGPSR